MTIKVARKINSKLKKINKHQIALKPISSIKMQHLSETSVHVFKLQIPINIRLKYNVQNGHF